MTEQEPPAPPAHKGIYPAVLAVQAAAKTMRETATNPHYGSSYTPLDTIVETVGPLLAEHGLVWMTFPCRDNDGSPALRYRLIHAATGEQVESMMPLLVTQPSPQGLGSALTYARRYSLCAVLNLVSDVDDDGARAQPAPAQQQQPKAPLQGATDAQRKRIHAQLKELGMTRDELQLIVGGWGIKLGEGWMDRLTPGRDGTASGLIEALKARKESRT